MSLSILQLGNVFYNTDIDVSEYLLRYYMKKIISWIELKILNSVHTQYILLILIIDPLKLLSVS